MFDNKKLYLGIFIGIVAAVVITCIAVAIGCAFNGLSFGEQIVSWAGHVCPTLEETAEELADTVTDVAETVASL